MPASGFWSFLLVGLRGHLGDRCVVRESCSLLLWLIVGDLIGRDVGWCVLRFAWKLLNLTVLDRWSSGDWRNIVFIWRRPPSSVVKRDRALFWLSLVLKTWSICWIVGPVLPLKRKSCLTCSFLVGIGVRISLATDLGAGPVDCCPVVAAAYQFRLIYGWFVKVGKRTSYRVEAVTRQRANLVSI